MSALRYCLFLPAAFVIACANEPVTALSSDVGGLLDAGQVIDTGPGDLGQGFDVVVTDVGSVDAGRDAGAPDSELPDINPGCFYANVEQVGPADIDELPSPNANASMVIREAADRESFLIAYELEPGPRSDEPYPVVRAYPRVGPHFAESDIYSLIPTTGIFDVQAGEPGFYHVVAGAESRVKWNALGRDHELEAPTSRVLAGGAFNGGGIYFPILPDARGLSGHYESLSLLIADLDNGSTVAVSLADGNWSLGYEQPKAAVDRGGDLWIGTVQSWDFPPTPVVSLIEPASGQTFETIYGQSCEELTGYDLVAYNGNVGMLSDCGSHGGTPSTRMTLGRGSFRADRTILENQAVIVPSRFAHNGSSLAVAVWEVGQVTPAVHFYTDDGSVLSTGGIRLPVPSGIVSNDQPLEIAIAGMAGVLGGFSYQSAAWAVAFAYRTPTGVRTFFARLGPCGTALPRP